MGFRNECSIKGNHGLCNYDRGGSGSYSRCISRSRRKNGISWASNHLNDGGGNISAYAGSQKCPASGYGWDVSGSGYL